MTAFEIKAMFLEIAEHFLDPHTPLVRTQRVLQRGQVGSQEPRLFLAGFPPGEGQTDSCSRVIGFRPERFLEPGQERGLSEDTVEQTLRPLQAAARKLVGRHKQSIARRFNAVLGGGR